MTTPKSIQIAVRIPHDLLRRVDQIAKELCEASPGITITRADVVRMLLEKAIAAGAAARPPKRRKDAA